MTKFPASKPKPISSKSTTFPKTDMLTNARDLYAKWPQLPIDEKHKIAESLAQKITVGKGRNRNGPLLPPLPPLPHRTWQKGNETYPITRKIAIQVGQPPGAPWPPSPLRPQLPLPHP